MIRFLLYLYALVIVIDAVVSFIPSLRGQEWVYKVKKLADLSNRPVRKILPPDLPFDPSPIVVILLIFVFIKLW